MFLNNFSVIPENVDQASDVLVTFLTKSEKNQIKKNKLWPSMLHQGMGSWIRNSWNLWSKNCILVEYFNELGIYHADDMTDIIFQSMFAKVKETEYDMMNHITELRNHWKSLGEDPDNLQI